MAFRVILTSLLEKNVKTRFAHHYNSFQMHDKINFFDLKGDRETWWWNEEVQKSIKEKEEAKKAWDKIRDENTKKVYKEKKYKAKKAVAMAKGHAYDDLYARLETKEGEKELYRLARQRET